MNDVLVAADNDKEESKEAGDFVELGEVSKDTKGSWGQSLRRSARWDFGAEAHHVGRAALSAARPICLPGLLD